MSRTADRMARRVMRRGRRRKPWWLALATIAIAACTGGVSSGPPSASAANAPGRSPEPSTATIPVDSRAGGIGSLVATLRVDSPRDVETAYGSVWVANGPAATVTRVDPRTRASIATIRVPDPASVLAAGDGAMWLTSYPGNSLTRIDARSNVVTKTISLASVGSGPIGVTDAGGFVWVANHDGTPVTSVAKIDPSTMAIVADIPVGTASDSGPTGLSFGAGSIWTDVPNLGAVVRIDPATGHPIATILVAGACGAIAAADDVVWVDGGDGDGCSPVLQRIDPMTNKVQATIRLGAGANALAIAPNGPWFGTSGYVGRIDPALNIVAGQLDVPGTPFGEAVGFGFVWLSDQASDAVYVVQPS